MGDMFSRFPTEAFADKRVNLTDLRVLGALGSWANSAGHAYPRPSSIAIRAGIDRRNVPASIARLMAAGYLKVVKRGRGKAEYWIQYRPELIPVDPKEGRENVMPGDDNAPCEEVTAGDVVMSGNEPLSCPEMTVVMPGNEPSLTAHKRPTKQPKIERGTRLPQDAMLPDEWRDWAIRERPDLDPDRTWATFHDHFISVTGSAGLKRDWFATWRNWNRREKKTRANLAQISGQVARAMAAGATFDDMFRYAAGMPPRHE